MFHFLRVMAVQRFVRFVSKTITSENNDDNGHRRHYVWKIVVVFWQTAMLKTSRKNDNK